MLFRQEETEKPDFHMQNDTTRPVGIDLFSGAGGLSLGFEQAGFDITAAVEIDPIHCATHEYNFPYTKTICASVTDLSGEKIRNLSKLGNRDIDVVFGGAPCQGFSLIGKRILEDPRNELASHFVRLVSELSPKYFLFENVKGLTLGKHRKFLDEMILELSKKGYEILLPYKVLNACDFGVPQSRQRLFLIGARKDQILPKYPERKSVINTVWDAIGDIPNADDFRDLESSDSIEIKWKTNSEYGKKSRGIIDDDNDFSFPRIYRKNMLTSSLKTKHSEKTKNRFNETPPGETEKISRFKKLDPSGLCNTLRAGTDSARGAFTSARPIHPIYPRVITVREAARLHSYPDWFRFHATKWHGFRQIGNSVPPMLGRAVASEIAFAMGYRPVKPTKKIKTGKVDLLYVDMAEAARLFKVPHNTIAQRLRPNKGKVTNG